MNGTRSPVPYPALRGDDATLLTSRTLLALQTALIGSLPAALQMRPFQFPSLQHLDERVRGTLQRARDVSGLSPKTCGDYQHAYSGFRSHLRIAGEESAFLRGDLSEQRRVLEGWIAAVRARGLTHTTVNTYWRGLHGLFVRLAREAQMIAPTQYVETPRPGKSLPRFLTVDALATVFRFVRNYQWRGGPFERARNVALVAVMALGGCRLGEVMRMQIEDVDLANQTIRVKRGKGPRGGKPRVVCMPPELTTAMTVYLDLRSRRQLAADRVFVAVRADAPLADITIRRLCRLIDAKTGIHVAPHLLRHTCATLMRQHGVADRLSMEQLGHASLGVLQKYSHVAPGERSQAMAQFRIGEEDDVIADARVSDSTHT